MLNNSKINRASIHYAGVVSYRIEKYRLLGLIGALKLGSCEAAHEIVLGHIAITLSMAARYAFINKKKKYDIVGVAVLALCDCVERIRTKQTILRDSHIDRYIQKYVSGKITNFLKTDHTVRPPLDSDWLVKEYREHGREIIFHYFGTHSLDRIHALTEDREHDITFYHPEPGTGDPYAKKYVKEVMNSRQFTQRERFIMLKKVEGYTDADIAVISGMSTSSITKIRLGLKDRVRKLLK